MSFGNVELRATLLIAGNGYALTKFFDLVVEYMATNRGLWYAIMAFVPFLGLIFAWRALIVLDRKDDKAAAEVWLNFSSIQFVLLVFFALATQMLAAAIWPPVP